MISPSEEEAPDSVDPRAVTTMPVRLLDEGRRGVSRLEFHSLERSGAVEEIETDGSDVLLREEVAALRGELQLQAERMAAGIEAARSEARSEARQEWEDELRRRIAKERFSILKICEEFREERARYFVEVEVEVVKLSLAIAARVIHREAELDPLLLTGVVRVALEKIAEDSETVLRVPVSTIDTWREAFVLGPESCLQIVADERMGIDECVLDTNVGRVELGVKAQLEEIERGFFDLMQRRPA